MQEEQKDFKHIVRIVNTDLDGNKKIVDALRKIKGVSFMFSNMVCSLNGIDYLKKAGDLSESEIDKLDKTIRNPSIIGAPEWMLNRRSDPEDGTTKHLTSSDIHFFKDNDIKMMKKIKTYKGIRHAFGLPVRGQNTKSNFRRTKSKGGGKSAIGVIRSKVAKAAVAEKETKKK